MSRTAYALFGALFLLSLCEPGLLRKTGSHGYPSSRTGLSGGGGHRYPSSHGGLSGTGSGHIHPSNTHQSQSYPSSGGAGGSHSYPGSTGLSGTGTGNRYPSPGGSQGSHGYPASKPSGSHSYPSSTGLSGNNNYRGQGSSTNVHYHYHYNPPQQIHYAPRGGPSYSYPVYHGTPPTYVYQYRDSSSKYGTLIAGLALLNLGALTASTYAQYRNRPYHGQPGEVCMLGIKKENGDYEETKIKCELISSFIWAEEEKRNNQKTNAPSNSSTSVVTTTVTNSTTSTNGGNPVINAPTPVYTMLPNGTLVEANVTLPNAMLNGTSPNGTANVTTSSVTTVTTTNTTTVADAFDHKNNGPPVKVTDGMQCFVTRRSPTSNMRHTVPCGLLQAYASKSLTNAAGRNVPYLGVVAAILVAFVVR